MVWPTVIALLVNVSLSAPASVNECFRQPLSLLRTREISRIIDNARTHTAAAWNYASLFRLSLDASTAMASL
jgi:hypothetical protein